MELFITYIFISTAVAIGIFLGQLLCKTALSLWKKRKERLIEKLYVFEQDELEELYHLIDEVAVLKTYQSRLALWEFIRGVSGIYDITIPLSLDICDVHAPFVYKRNGVVKK